MRPSRCLRAAGAARRAAEKRSGVDALPGLAAVDASIEALREEQRRGLFEARRFRPNILIGSAERAHQEDEWLDASVRIGAVDRRVRMRDSSLRDDHARIRDSGENDLDTLR